MKNDDLDPEVRRRIEADPDYIVSGHHRNSLTHLAAKYPDGAPVHVAARALGQTEQQHAIAWARLVTKLRRLMGVKKGK